MNLKNCARFGRKRHLTPNQTLTLCETGRFQLFSPLFFSFSLSLSRWYVIDHLMNWLIFFLFLFHYSNFQLLLSISSIGWKCLGAATNWRCLVNVWKTCGLSEKIGIKIEKTGSTSDTWARCSTSAAWWCSTSTPASEISTTTGKLFFFLRNFLFLLFKVFHRPFQ